MISAYKIDSELTKYVSDRYSLVTLSDKYLFVSSSRPSYEKTAFCDFARIDFDNWLNIEFFKKVLDDFRDNTGIEPILEVEDEDKPVYNGVYLHKNFIMALADWVRNPELKNVIENIVRRIDCNY